MIIRISPYYISRVTTRKEEGEGARPGWLSGSPPLPGLSAIIFASLLRSTPQVGGQERAIPISGNTDFGNYWLTSGRPFPHTFFANKMLK